MSGDQLKDLKILLGVFIGQVKKLLLEEIKILIISKQIHIKIPGTYLILS